MGIFCGSEPNSLIQSTANAAPCQNNHISTLIPHHWNQYNHFHQRFRHFLPNKPQPTPHIATLITLTHSLSIIIISSIIFISGSDIFYRINLSQRRTLVTFITFIPGWCLTNHIKVQTRTLPDKYHPRPHIATLIFIRN